MALAEVKKIRLVAHHHIRSLILDELQQTGWVHITDLQEAPEAEMLGLKGLDVSPGDISERLGEIDYAMNFLAPYKPPQDWREKLTQAKPIVTRAQLENTLKENDVKQICHDCRLLDEKLSELLVHISELKVDLEGLSHWRGISIPVQELVSTKYVQLELVKIPQDAREEFAGQLEQEVGDMFLLQPVSANHGFCCELLIYLKEYADKVTPVLANYGVEPIELPDIPGTPAEVIAQIEQQVADKTKKQAVLRKQVVALASQYQVLALAHDYYTNQKLKAEVQASFLATSQTFLIEGWINRRQVERLKKRLEDKFAETEVLISEPEKGDIPPVELTNSRLVSPFEAVTKLYGLPHHNEQDPTPLLAPFFFVFFGLCLTDAGYGLILALLTYLGLRYLLLAEGSRNMLRLLFCSGIASILAGAITGSWFGDIINFLPDVFSPLKVARDSLILFDPINDPNGPMLFMMISLILGFIQVWYGIGIKMYAEIKEGARAAALFDQFPWMLIFLGLTGLGLQKAEVIGQAWSVISLGLIYTGVGVILLFNGREYKNIFKRLGIGILGLYGSIGYFSDILSYSRLLALGLATGVIATVINKIAFITTGIPVIGYVFTFLILIGGHLFNLAISGLGAFVHTSRLQFVEFFPKFFRGGGRAFMPFKWESKYSIVTD